MTASTVTNTLCKPPLSMKTVRFSEVVKSSGKPDTHLLLIAPAKDKTLQAAIKSNRVMTVYQESGSTKSDYGTIGFVEGSSRQFLVFPQTLKPFADKRVIGIKYDLLESMPVSKGETKTEIGQASKPTPDIAATEVDNLRPARPKGNLSDYLFDDGSDDLSDEASSDIQAAPTRSAKSEASSDNRTAATRLAKSDASSDDRTMATRSAKSDASSDDRTMANRERSRDLSDDASDEAPSGERTMATRSAKSEASADVRTTTNRGRSRNKADKPGDEQPNAAPKSLAAVLAKSTGATTSKKKPSAAVQPQDKKSAPAEKVVEFPKPESNQQRSDHIDEVEELKRRVRKAIEVLEQGKQVAAYNLLKRIVED
jgi:hypothetical protein